MHLRSIVSRKCASCDDDSRVNTKPKLTSTPLVFSSTINNCSLTSIPTQLVSGDSVTSLDLAYNAITKIPTDFQNQEFSTLASM